MKKLILMVGMATMLIGCESLYEPAGIESIRSQRQVDAYNATVSADEDKLVCTREKPLGSNIPRFTCMTIAQQTRLALRAQEDLQVLRTGSGVSN